MGDISNQTELVMADVPYRRPTKYRELDAYHIFLTTPGCGGPEVQKVDGLGTLYNFCQSWFLAKAVCR
jgi:hypothetical protein